MANNQIPSLLDINIRHFYVTRKVKSGEVKIVGDGANLSMGCSSFKWKRIICCLCAATAVVGSFLLVLPFKVID